MRRTNLSLHYLAGYLLPAGPDVAHSITGLFEMDADGSNVSQVGNVPGLMVGFWSISPDGARAALGVQGTDKVRRIVIVGIGQGGGVTGPIPGTEDGSNPAWSLDGGRIAFEKGGIWVVDAGGGNLHQVVAAGGHPAWSPDGTRLAYIIWDGLHLILHIVNADGTGDAVVTASAIQPAWSPDGTKIVFARPLTNTGSTIGQIFIINVDGSNERQLTSGGESTAAPAWSPDGTRIAFAEFVNKVAQIWMINVDGSDQHALTSGGLANTSPVWVP